jgi:hypothetical protein
VGVKDHPLFDPSDAPKRDLHFIVVQRLQSGTWITSPAPHTVDDFPNLAALQATYGGGKYRLFARDAANAKITARKDWDLPGPPLPFPGEAPTATPGAPAPATPAGLDPVIALMLQQSQKSEERSMQFMQMMMNMQNQNAQQVAAMMAAQAEAAAASQQQMMGIVAAIVQRPQADPSQLLVTGLTTGMNLMREAAGGGGGDSGDGGSEEDLITSLARPFVEGAMAAAGQKAATPEPEASGANAESGAPSQDGKSGGAK